MPGLLARSTNIPPLGSFCPFRGTRWHGPQHLSADKQQVLLTGTADGASLTLFHFLCCLHASPLDRSLSLARSLIHPVTKCPPPTSFLTLKLFSNSYYKPSEYRTRYATFALASVYLSIIPMLGSTPLER